LATLLLSTLALLHDPPFRKSQTANILANYLMFAKDYSSSCIQRQ
jgi:hypothetical protein